MCVCVAFPRQKESLLQSCGARGAPSVCVRHQSAQSQKTQHENGKRHTAVKHVTDPSNTLYMKCTFKLNFVSQLWISRIAAATREHGMKYPALVHNLLKVSVCVTSVICVGHACGVCVTCFLCVFTVQRTAQQTRVV